MAVSYGFINRAVKPRPLGRGYKALQLSSLTGIISRLKS